MRAQLCTGSVQAQAAVISVQARAAVRLSQALTIATPALISSYEHSPSPSQLYLASTRGGLQHHLSEEWHAFSIYGCSLASGVELIQSQSVDSKPSSMSQVVERDGTHGIPTSALPCLSFLGGGCADAAMLMRPRLCYV